MSERKNAGSERSGSSYGSTMPRKSKYECCFLPGNAPFDKPQVREAKTCINSIQKTLP